MKIQYHSILGLTSSLLMIVISLLDNIKILNNIYWLETVFETSPILVIFSYIAIRFVLVKIASLKNFNIILVLIISFQSAMLVLLLYAKYMLGDSRILSSSILFLGLILTVLTIWFFISLSKVDKQDVIALNCLQFYALFILLGVIFKILPDVILVVKKSEMKSLRLLIDLSAIIQYLFLTIFFLKNSSFLNHLRTT
jgi:hypothetical protein